MAEPAVVAAVAPPVPVVAAPPVVPPAMPPAAPATAVIPAASTLLTDASKEPPKAEVKPPVEIKLTLPKDSLLTQAQVDKIAAISRERGLSQEQADAVMANQNGQLQEFRDANVKAWQERTSAWEKELQANKEFGGEKLKEFDAGASEVVIKYGGQDMLKLLKDSGYAKNPAVAQFLWNIHKAMRPDKIVAPGAPSAPAKMMDVADRLFPTTARKG